MSALLLGARTGTRIDVIKDDNVIYGYPSSAKSPAQRGVDGLDDAP